MQRTSTRLLAFAAALVAVFAAAFAAGAAWGPDVEPAPAQSTEEHPR